MGKSWECGPVCVGRDGKREGGREEEEGRKERTKGGGGKEDEWVKDGETLPGGQETPTFTSKERQRVGLSAHIFCNSKSLS